MVYLCRAGEIDYTVLLSRVTGYPWIVIFDMQGAVETATRAIALTTSASVSVVAPSGRCPSLTSALTRCRR